MSPTLFRSLCGQFLRMFGAMLPSVVLIFLVADLAGSTRFFSGSDWLRVVPALYFNKCLVVTHQLAPAALLLSAGMVVSALRKRGELTALGALGFSPGALLFPLGLCTALVCAGLVVLDEQVVVHASRTVERLSSAHMVSGGDWRSYFGPKQWFRRGPNIFHLREGSAETGFQRVTILTLGPNFTLERRLDAAQMLPESGSRWQLKDVVEHRFTPAGVTVQARADASFDLGAEPSAFRIRAGRPEQMRLREIREQTAVRAKVGLPASPFVLALHNRFAYPLAALPAALLSALLACRPGRKGHLTTALVEGMVVTMGMWGLTVVCRTLVLSSRMSPQLAAWLPALLLTSASLLLWLKLDGTLSGLPRRLRSRWSRL